QNIPTIALDTVYAMRFDYNGTLLEGKLWQDGAAEPSYQVGCNDTNFDVGLSGLAAYWDRRTAGAYVEFSAFAVAPGGSVAQFPSTSATQQAPTIASFNPTSGTAGVQVQIVGTSFTSATAVNFNGTSAAFSVVDASHITGTVPSGATSGPISVTTPAGTG